MNIKIYNGDLPSDLNLSDEKEVALDCEALGLVLGRDPLTLVQIGLKNNNYHLIKLDRENYNAPNLKKFLSNSNATFIMHYARQDMLWLKYHLHVNLKNIFCSKLSSKLVRTASQFHGYKDLVKESQSLKGVRGGVRDSGLNIHSIRIPGLLAHQIVIMGSPGETYTIRHDTIDRKAYMPGVLQAIRKIGSFNSLIYGLEKLIF